MKVIIVTGASSGIGEEFVKQLDKSLQRIDEIWMVARDKKKMEEIAAGLTNKSRLFSLDLERPMDRKDFNEILSSLKPSICMLINSACCFSIIGYRYLLHELYITICRKCHLNGCFAVFY